MAKRISKIKPVREKNDLIGFRAPPEIKDKLETYENKSEIVNLALGLYFGLYKVCPKCYGSGKIRLLK